MSVQLMTGNTAAPVPSVSDGSLYAGIIGTGSYVQKIGKMCAASLDGPNKLVVQSGSIVHNGRHIRMLGNTEFTIPSGLQAQKRANLCVIRYKSEPDGGESAEHLVLTGEAVSDGEPPDPEINSGSILDLATVSDMPLYRVVTDGINALDPEPLFDVMVPMSELWDSKSQGTELWAGDWTSGTIEVPGISNYSLLAVFIHGGPICLCTNFGTSFVGGAIYEDANAVHLSLAVQGSISGEVLTYKDASSLYHNANGSHGGRTTGKRITRIVGLL